MVKHKQFSGDCIKNNVKMTNKIPIHEHKLMKFTISKAYKSLVHWSQILQSSSFLCIFTAESLGSHWIEVFYLFWSKPMDLKDTTNANSVYKYDISTAKPQFLCNSSWWHHFSKHIVVKYENKNMQAMKRDICSSADCLTNVLWIQLAIFIHIWFVYHPWNEHFHQIVN